jgi:HAD superfamily hydrolase (TIGR01509 family)
MARLKALLFDVDGTLAETEEFHRQAFNAAFEAAGVDAHWTTDHYRALLKVTGGKERLRAYFEARGEDVPDARIAALHRDKNARYAALLAAGEAGLRPGVLRLIRAAPAEGVRLGIATTTSPANVAALLDAFLPDWRSRFSCVVAGDEVSRKKPAPDVYLEALLRLGIDADEAVAFEDSAQGVRAACAAGIRTVATPGIYTAGDALGGAVSVLPDLGDPQAPWPQAQQGCRNPWLEIEDLRRLLRATPAPRRAASVRECAWGGAAASLVADI